MDITAEALKLLQEILDDEAVDGEYTYTQLDDELRNKARAILAAAQADVSIIQLVQRENGISPSPKGEIKN